MLKVNAVKIAQAMVEQGLGRQELCDRAGVDTRTLKKTLDQGEMVRIDSLSRLARELKIPVVELIIDAAPSGETKVEPELVSERRPQCAEVAPDHAESIRGAVVGRIRAKAARNP